jgi:ribosomal protein S18 acetylase RimI-like enzyme
VLSSVDRRIQQSVVANLSGRPAALDSGPFVLGLDPATTSPHINYATPRPDVPITAADVAALVTAFRAADRQPRLEYVVNCAPALEELLLAAGFTIEERHGYLVCEPATLIDGDGVHALREPATRQERAALVAAQNESFGGGSIATEVDIARVERLQERGGVALMALAGDGSCAGGGQANPPSGGVSEVAGIAVRPPYRRRGLAGAITAGITRRLVDLGADLAWLEASGEDSWRVYERVGYRAAGRRLYISMP